VLGGEVLSGRPNIATAEHDGMQKEDRVSDHKFKVGQTVSYTTGPFGRASGTSIYKITALLPPRGEDRQYRIKSPNEPHERVATESELARAV
jgi:hypothetical protein